jgi:phosphoglycolate phosphatase
MRMNSEVNGQKVNELKLVVFDCDGTLVDSQHAIFRCMSAAFSKYSLPNLRRDSVRRIVGLSLHQAISVLAPEANFDLVESLRLAYSDEWQKMRTNESLEEPLFPGTLEAINTAKDAGWLLGVATGKSYNGLVATLSHYGVLDKFVTLQTSDKVINGKPNPDMMLAALKDANVDKSNAVMVGDTTFDIDMAMNAGVRAIGVSWGYHDASELMESGAQCVINDFHELQSILVDNENR